MTTKTWVAAGAALSVVAVGAVAAAFASDWTWSKSDRNKGPRGSSFGNTRLIQFDANKDGRITRGEIDSGLSSQFAGADSNSDGKLDGTELQRYNDQRRAERKARYDAWRAKNPDAADQKQRYQDRGRDGFDPLKYSDWNQDGFVSPEEFGGRIRSQAMRADRDNDGTVLVEDLKKGRVKRGEKPATPQSDSTSTPDNTSPQDGSASTP